MRGRYHEYVGSGFLFGAKPNEGEYMTMYSARNRVASPEDEVRIREGFESDPAQHAWDPDMAQQERALVRAYLQDKAAQPVGDLALQAS